MKKNGFLIVLFSSIKQLENIVPTVRSWAQGLKDTRLLYRIPPLLWLSTGIHVQSKRVQSIVMISVLSETGSKCCKYKCSQATSLHSNHFHAGFGAKQDFLFKPCKKWNESQKMKGGVCDSRSSFFAPKLHKKACYVYTG